MPRISIVVPAYNSARYICETIESVLGQTFTDWELLVVDDGSTDETREVVTRYPRTQLLQHDGGSNRGACASRILGARNASGEIVAPLDADDLWEPNHLADHLAFWDSVERPVLTCGRSREWWPGHEDGKIGFAPSPGVHAPGSLLAEWLHNNFETTPLNGALFVRPEIYPEIECYENVARGRVTEDQFLCWHVAIHSPIWVHDGVWLKYRRHNEAITTTRSHLRHLDDKLAFFRAIAPEIAAAYPGDPINDNVAAKITDLRRDIRGRRWRPLRRAASRVRRFGRVA